MEIKGIFDKWEIDDYSITYKDYDLWVANGFFFFVDNRTKCGAKPFLKGMGIVLKYRLWREYKRINKQRRIRIKQECRARIQQQIKCNNDN